MSSWQVAQAKQIGTYIFGPEEDTVDTEAPAATERRVGTSLSSACDVHWARVLMQASCVFTSRSSNTPNVAELSSKAIRLENTHKTSDRKTKLQREHNRLCNEDFCPQSPSQSCILSALTSSYEISPVVWKTHNTLWRVFSTTGRRQEYYNLVQ